MNLKVQDLNFNVSDGDQSSTPQFTENPSIINQRSKHIPHWKAKNFLTKKSIKNFPINITITINLKRNEETPAQAQIRFREVQK